MALIEKISSSDLYNLACKMNRGENFGYKGWRAIGDHLEELSEDMGQNIEIDIIGICCDYSMAESVEEAFMEFPHKHGTDLPTMEGWEEMDDNEKLETIEKFLRNETSVVTCEDDNIIWQAF